MFRIKRKNRLIYRHYPGWTPYNLKVICKEDWGGKTVAKCKVLTKGWYNEIYITQEDLSIQAGTNFSRVVFK